MVSLNTYYLTVDEQLDVLKNTPVRLQEAAVFVFPMSFVCSLPGVCLTAVRVSTQAQDES